MARSVDRAKVTKAESPLLLLGANPAGTTGLRAFPGGLSPSLGLLLLVL